MALGTKHTPSLSYFIQVNTNATSSTMKLMAACLDKYHNEFSAEELSCKCGIGLEKSRATLYATTQINFSSAILPLNNRYRTDLLYQKLSILIIKFYTAALFYNETSMRGNKCA